MKIVKIFSLSILFSVNNYAQETIKIPDIGFEEALIDLGFDSNGLNGDILVSDTKYIVNLNVNDPTNNKLLPNVYSKIKSLEGIEHFPNLKRLDCQGNEISKINLTKNAALTFLNCSNNKIEYLDLSNNTKLFSISCDNNKIGTLKLGVAPDLKDLYCNNNKLTQLNIKECPVLENLDASGNKIKSIVIKKEFYDKYSEGWYKDSGTVYTEKIDETPIQEVVNNVAQNQQQTKQAVIGNSTTSAANNTSVNDTSNYYEKFQLSVVNEYDNLVLNPSYLENKKQEIQHKYELDPQQLTKWIQEYGSLSSTNKTLNTQSQLKEITSSYYKKFKRTAVAEYEKLVLSPEHLQSKREEIRKKFNLDAEQLEKWIEEYGIFTTKKLQVNSAAGNLRGDTATYYTQFKQSVVAEYERSVLNLSYVQSKRKEIQRKYNLNVSQINEWIKKYSKTVVN